MQWCVLLPVVLTLIATQDPDDKIGKIVANYCYPKWALEAFVIANAQRLVNENFLFYYHFLIYLNKSMLHALTLLSVPN